MSEQVQVQEVPVQASAGPAANAAPMLLINLSSPIAATPICRVGTRQEVTGQISVRQLIENSTSLRSPMSLDVSVVQLESEMSTLLGIGGMVAAGTAEVLVRGAQGQLNKVDLEAPVQTVVREETGAHGNTIWIIDLEIHPAGEAPDVPFLDRRQWEVQAGSEAEPAPAHAAPKEAPAPLVLAEEVCPARGLDEPTPSGLSIRPYATDSEGGDAARVAVTASAPSAPPPAPAPEGSKIVIMAAGPSSSEAAEPKGYIRKTDLLRAQFRPEVEELDLSGLFVCEFGMVIREQRERRNVVLSDATRITEVLLQGNGFRRSGHQAKALSCYQELVDMDPSNADFRFLLGKTMALLGREEEAMEALSRARELGHEGARKEIETMRAAGIRARKPLGFLRFWKQ